ncbi:MAG: radical SAM protein [bacterium]|nr:radical SAM protein [bacterium]
MNNGLETASIYLTENCNLKCDYCYEDHNGRVMDSQVMDRVIEFCCDNAWQKQFRFWLFGGEPFLVEDRILEFIPKAIQTARKKGITPRFNVLTNGTIFSSAFAEFWRSHGYVALQVSLDGVKEAHDRHRKTKDGKPTFSRIVENIKEYLKYRRDLHIRLTVMLDTVRFLSESIRFILNLGVRTFALMPVHEVEWRKTDKK